MSVLDQAFIKAFSKEAPADSRESQPSNRPTTSETKPMPPANSPAPAALPLATTARQSLPESSGPEVSQSYDSGMLYHTHYERLSAASPVPPPHLVKTPKGRARRVLRRLESTTEFETREIPQQRIADEDYSRAPRRMRPIRVLEIIRQLEETREQLARLPQQGPVVIPVDDAFDNDVQEIAKTTPSISQHIPAVPEIAAPPSVAKTTEVKTGELKAVETAAIEAKAAEPVESPYTSDPLHIAVHGHWEQLAGDESSSMSSLVMFESAEDLPLTRSSMMVSVDLSSLDLSPPFDEVIEQSSIEPSPAATSAVASVEPMDAAAKPKFRVDKPHAAVAGPHQKPATEKPAIDLPVAEVIADSQDTEPAEPQQPEVIATSEAETTSADEIELAEELQLAEEVATPPSMPLVEEPTIHAPRTCIPLWAVDRFDWPTVCEKLLRSDNSYFSEAGEKLRIAVRDGLKTLGITGSRRGEGRSTLALCLARAAASSGIQVAIVDADFTRPQLAGMLGLEVAYGWQDAATGQIPLSEAAIKSKQDRITVLPLEVSSAADPLSLGDPRVTATFRALAATFDLVIIDMPPIAMGDEPLFPADETCPMDAMIVVRDTRYATTSESHAIGDRLYACGAEAVGIAENFVSEDSSL